MTCESQGLKISYCNIWYHTLQHHSWSLKCLSSSDEKEKKNPVVSEVIRIGFFMDDLLTSADTKEGCILTQEQIRAIFDSAKLPISKRCPSSSGILEMASNFEKNR